MRSRTHRLPTSEPPDDWVDGSWTVDCVCGVNFDDGEEMVNCDECGVWVHTRCSRYVKSEKSFACDKCKSKSKNSRNDSCEETEVAQLLVELPTKTLRMDNPYPSDCPPRQPFRLWTDVPIEERVHVQGVPGGDPALFGGLSSVFTPELWKCTGFVPKKFNFQYREFPCWDEHVKQEFDAKIEEENENPVDKGAGVLFSLSKENVLPGMKRQVEDMKKGEVEDLDVRRPRNGVKKERSLLRPFVIHSGKRKKEDLGGTSTDRSGKKKARVVDKEGDSRNRAPHASKTASTLSSDAKQLEFYEDRGLKVLKIDTPSIKNGNLRDTEPEDPLSGGCHVVQNDVDEPKNNLASSDHPSEALSSDVSRHNFSVGARPKEDKAGHQVSARIESSPKTVDGVASILEHNDIGSLSVKEEVVGVALDNVNDNGGGSSRSAGIDSRTEPLVEDLATAAPEVKDNQNFQDSNGDMSPNSLQSNVKFKTEVDIDNSGGVLDVEPSLDDVKLDGDNLSENVKVNSVAITSSQSSDHKVQYVDKSTDAVSDCQIVKPDELPGDPCQLKQQLEGSVGSMAGRKSSSELKHGPRPAEEPSKSGGSILAPPAPPSQRKMIVSVGKSSSTSSTTVISRPSISDNHRPANAQKHNSSSKQLVMPKGNVSIKKDNAAVDVVRDEDGREMPKKILKERLKFSVSSVLKASHSTNVSHAYISKRTSSDSKDPELFSSSKASSTQNIAVTSGSGESASLLPTQSALHVQNKMTASGLPHRGEKVNLLNSQASSKVNNTPSMHPPAPSNSAAVLSDEELALLLHQELNSSPRVPRVPRMRHAGSLPQLASPTATSMLMKRTSSSGGKDHGLVSRRKNKDLAKDGSRSSREIDDDAKKMDRVPSSPDQRRHDSVCTTDPFTKREADNRSGKGVHSVKKCIPSASTATVSSGLSSSAEVNEQNFSSTRNSPRNASDDDTGTNGGPSHRTLPGLIAEIMSKGKRMTYEELCNAVLPHWPNLRKHNGERYAYSSHSQAVLDCLRNRHEWARLVDRGPKTNASWKRRKLDAEPTSFESEDNEFGKDRTMKEVESKSFESHREEFPKGKRKARKRRRLALQGRGIKDVRRRRKAEVLSDDDIGSFSSSSEESIFSEDEIQGGGKCPVRSEASASSDEMGTL
uniref:Zinc finger PHD-type domain-containing protein n=1 Tax=Davidia involucrata TaxID=16924 RepID=A0A5B6ZMZ7_DAVIN